MLLLHWSRQWGQDKEQFPCKDTTREIHKEIHKPFIHIHLHNEHNKRILPNKVRNEGAQFTLLICWMQLQLQSQLLPNHEWTRIQFNSPLLTNQNANAHLFHLAHLASGHLSTREDSAKSSFVKN